MLSKVKLFLFIKLISLLYKLFIVSIIPSLVKYLFISSSNILVYFSLTTENSLYISLLDLNNNNSICLIIPSKSKLKLSFINCLNLS